MLPWHVDHEVHVQLSVHGGMATAFVVTDATLDIADQFPASSTDLIAK